jgi:hypothetical protein
MYEDFRRRLEDPLDRLGHRDHRRLSIMDSSGSLTVTGARSL